MWVFTSATRAVDALWSSWGPPGPQGPFWGQPQPVTVHGAAPAQGQHLPYPLAGHHEDPVMFLQPLEAMFQAPLDGNTTLDGISHSSQFHIICKCADTAAQSTRFTNIEVKQFWPQ